MMAFTGIVFWFCWGEFVYPEERYNDDWLVRRDLAGVRKSIYGARTDTWSGDARERLPADG